MKESIMKYGMSEKKVLFIQILCFMFVVIVLNLYILYIKLSPFNYPLQLECGICFWVVLGRRFFLFYLRFIFGEWCLPLTLFTSFWSGNRLLFCNSLKESVSLDVFVEYI